MNKKLLIITFIVIPLITYIFNLIPNNAARDRIIYYSIPEYYTSMSGSVVGKSLAYVCGSNGRIPLGHAGIIIEDKNGNMYRYDYGRFSHCLGSATLPRLKGNWVKEYIGNYKDRSIDEITNELGHRILNRFNKSGNTVNFYVMKGNSKDAIKFIESEANNPNRDRYKWYLDHSCCGRARSAFDHGRPTITGFVISKIADVTTNFIPNGSSIAQTIFDRNLTAFSGLSVEGNAPLIGTSKYTYKRD